MNSKIIYAILIPIFIVSAIFFNYDFLEDIIIPDSCYYHNHDYQTTAVFDLFYHFPGGEGGHPFPTLLNFLLTLSIGAFIGWLSARFLVRILRSWDIVSP